jgi:hypothetical protein
MKLPEPLFAIINPVMRLVLRSPLHFLLSGSLMLITFTGRKSGRRFTTPVRYIETDDVIRCFTSRENQWWRNVRGGADVVLRIAGRDRVCHAIAIENDPAETRKWLEYYLGLFPQDAVYHDIGLNKDKSLVAEDLEAALSRAIVVEARPKEDRS